MAVNNVTIDFNRLETFHPAERSPELMDIYFSAYPTAAIFYKVAMAGSLDAASQMKDWANNFIHGRVSTKSNLFGGRGTYESPVLFSPLSGTTDGSGVNPITNSPVQAYTKARWDLNRKYTPVALPSDEWGMAQAIGDSVERGVVSMNLMTSAFGNAFKTHLSAINSDLIGTNTSSEAGVLSLIAGFGTSATETGTYGNISRSSITQWRSNYDTGTLANWITNTSADFCVSIMGEMVDTVQANGANLNDLLFIMGSDTFRGYRRSLQGLGTTNSAYYRFDADSGRKIPHAELYYSGGIPVIHDPNLTAKRVYLIDTATTYLIGVSGNIFKLSDWNLSENATQEWARLHTFSNVVMTKPNNNFYYLTT